MLKKTLLLLFAFVLTACSGDYSPSIKIDTYDEYSHNSAYVEIEITAIVDDVEVQDIIVNRGNCTVFTKNRVTRVRLPRRLRYGEYITVATNSRCSASEVEVITDDGDWVETY